MPLAKPPWHWRTACLTGSRAWKRSALRLAWMPTHSAEQWSTGPPPEEWRGGIRTSRGRAHGDPFHAGPRLDRGAVAQSRVRALPVVEDLDVLEHRRLRLRTGAEADVVDVLLLQRGEEAVHGRVVEAVPLAAHRLLDAVSSQDLAVGLRGVLGGFNWSSQRLSAPTAAPHQGPRLAFASRASRAAGR